MNTLSLVHGSLVEGEGPMLVVETALPDAPSGGGPLRILAEDVWSGRAHTVFEAIERVRARWSGHTPFDATPPSRTGDVIVVDGVPIQFDRLARPDEWVACARVGAYRVTLEARCFPVEGLELVRVTDLAPYILGSRRFDAGADGST
ncbi:MAG TPA: hypothetical protein VFC04_04215 [Actinomycetota bacterium]|nr:hypothetical protein [Actinomycetota bacterium]